MAAGLSTAAANAVIEDLKATYAWVQLHDGDPGAAGTTAVANSGTREQVTWGTVANGAMSNSSPVAWTSVTDSTDYTHFTVWDQEATGGTFGFSGTVTANEVTAGDSFEIPLNDLDVSIPTAS